jgi:hypothetical protein
MMVGLPGVIQVDTGLLSVQCGILNVNTISSLPGLCSACG